MDICFESADVEQLRELDHLHPIMDGNHLQTAADCEAVIDSDDDPFQPLLKALADTLGNGFEYCSLCVQSDGSAFLFCKLKKELVGKALCLMDLFGLEHCVLFRSIFV